MSNLKQLYRLPIYILAAGLVSSCGATGSFSGSGSASTSANISTTTSTSTGTSTSTSTVTGTGTNPALQYGGILVTSSEATAGQFAYTSYSAACNGTISGSGKVPVCSNGATPSYISTTNLLQVQVTPAGAGLLNAPTGTYSGFSGNYNCASYQVQVVDESGNILGSQQTGMLAINADAPCMDAGGNAITTTSQILNFSSEISQSSHGGLDVQISAVNYDFYCKMLYDYLGEYAIESEYYNIWCPNKPVYYDHTVGASMEIEINGTTF